MPPRKKTATARKNRSSGPTESNAKKACYTARRMLPTSELDAIIKSSLKSFYQQVDRGWWGRENEAVNLYAWGHLAKEVRPKGILHDLTQIGIEVAVRQKPLPKFKGIARTVRKDLVIWPEPAMNLWKD